MQALRVHDFAEGLRLDTLPDATPGPGEVCVQVQACGVSFFDMLISRGGYQWRPPLPFVVGSEFAGVVDALGNGAQGSFAVGDRVCGSTSIGAWTQRLCVPVNAIHLVAPQASIEEAAVLCMPYGTSLYALRERGRLQPGETVLVLGATGSVGHAAVQLARALGARVIGAVTGAAKRAAALEAGAQEVVDLADEGWKDRVKALAGSRGADVVFDPVGLWIEGTEGAKFWMKVFNDLKTRGVNDILIAVTDGLKGMAEALAAVFPATTLQTCIVHLIRNSLDYASWKDRKTLAQAIRPIYTAVSAEAALCELDAFEHGAWGRKFPTVVAAWRRAWDKVIPFFAFPPAVRKVVYTTNAIESVNARLRKIIKTRGHFPSDDAATKLIWLALRNITADWARAAQDWKVAMNQFAILYQDRFTKAAA